MIEPENTTAQALLASYRPGYSLPAGFYASPSLYASDLERIFFRNWIYAGHLSQLPGAGAYLLVDIGDESIIVVRDGEGTIRAFANVCRHRGSRLCTEPAGKLRRFVCPYHAWAYELDGKLATRRDMPADFDRARHGLKPVRCASFHGLVFVNLDTEAPDLTTQLAPVSACFDIYALAQAKIAHRETFPVAANWKLTIENFMECYHCAPAHTEYSRLHALKNPRDNEALRPAMLERARELGYQIESVDNSCPAEAGSVPYYYARNALYRPHVSGSRDGRAAAPLLGQVRGYDGGVADFQIGPASYGLLYADHAVLYRFVPRGVQHTDMEIVWLVQGQAVAGRDYALDDLTWLWRVTTEADKKIILNNQRGVNSRYYEPGPLSQMELFTEVFLRWYLAQLKSIPPARAAQPAM